jgi:hypothetical protein
MRKWLSYKLMRWAVALDPELTLRLAMAMITEHTRQLMEERGIDRFTANEEPDGTVPLTPVTINRDPTIH